MEVVKKKIKSDVLVHVYISGFCARSHVLECFWCELDRFLCLRLSNPDNLAKRFNIPWKE